MQVFKNILAVFSDVIKSIFSSEAALKASVLALILTLIGSVIFTVCNFLYGRYTLPHDAKDSQMVVTSKLEVHFSNTNALINEIKNARTDEDVRKIQFDDYYAEMTGMPYAIVVNKAGRILNLTPKLYYLADQIIVPPKIDDVIVFTANLTAKDKMNNLVFEHWSKITDDRYLCVAINNFYIKALMAESGANISLTPFTKKTVWVINDTMELDLINDEYMLAEYTDLRLTNEKHPFWLRNTYDLFPNKLIAIFASVITVLVYYIALLAFIQSARLARDYAEKGGDKLG